MAPWHLHFSQPFGVLVSGPFRSWAVSPGPEATGSLTGPQVVMAQGPEPSCSRQHLSFLKFSSLPPTALKNRTVPGATQPSLYQSATHARALPLFPFNSPLTWPRALSALLLLGERCLPSPGPVSLSFHLPFLPAQISLEGYHPSHLSLCS